MALAEVTLDGAEVAALLEELERLRNALRTYGQHRGGPGEPEDGKYVAQCRRWVSMPCTDTGLAIDDGQPCTCGFSGALLLGGPIEHAALCRTHEGKGTCDCGAVE